MSEDIYCDLCHACGEPGCCPAEKCRYFKAYWHQLAREASRLIVERLKLPCSPLEVENLIIQAKEEL